MTTSKNLKQWRAETPGCKHRIHLNNAGAGLMPMPVIKAFQEYFEMETQIGGYETAAVNKATIDGFYSSMATFLNTQSRNIAYAGSATDAYNRALSAVPFQSGDTIITTDDDYVSNQIAFLQLQKEYDLQLIRARQLASGGVDPQDVEKLIQKHHPRLVAITHIPTNSGLIQDIYSIGELCRQHDILYLVDACQSAGQLPLDVQKIHCDFLSATMRKFLRGPRGAGFLYVSDKVLEAGYAPKYLDLHSARWTDTNNFALVDNALRFELWEKSLASVVGSKAAIDYALQIGLDEIAKAVQQISQYTRQQLQQIPGLRILDRGEQQAGIITLFMPKQEPIALQQTLEATYKINSSLSYFEYARIDLGQKQVPWVLRISPHYFNTKEEVDQLVAALLML